jgi:hypothetical protein
MVGGRGGLATAVKDHAGQEKRKVDEASQKEASS